MSVFLDGLDTEVREDEPSHSIQSSQSKAGNKTWNGSLFGCGICGKTFTLKGNLKRHAIQHSGKRPFVCSDCGRSFTQKVNLVSHQKRCTKSLEKSIEQKSIDSSATGDETNLICEECGRMYTDRAKYKRHLYKHKIGDRHACTICYKVCISKAQLIEHERCHTGEKPFQCNVCLSAFASMSTLRKHEKTHLSQKQFACEHCNKRFHTRGNLNIHLRIHTGEKPYQCDICSKSFTQKGSLVNHKRSHLNDRPFQCSLCPKAFITTTELNRHFEAKHTESQMLKCDICKEVFISSKELREHILSHQCRICLQTFPLKSVEKHVQREHFKSGEIIECGTCSQRLMAYSEFLDHEQSHRKTHECDHCGRSFSDAIQLEKHDCGQKEYVCIICQKAFHQKSKMDAHMSVHIDEKEFECHFCNKTFTKKGYLTRHNKEVHSGEKPYICDVCGKDFVRPQHLSEHRLTHAPNHGKEMNFPFDTEVGEDSPDEVDDSPEEGSHDDDDEGTLDDYGENMPLDSENNKTEEMLRHLNFVVLKKSDESPNCEK